jgi:hypothetical protein
MEWTGSPPSKKAPTSFNIFDENSQYQVCIVHHIQCPSSSDSRKHQMKRTASAVPMPMGSIMSVNRPKLVHKVPCPTTSHAITGSDNTTQPSSIEAPVTELLAKLSKQQQLLSRQKRDLEENENRSNSSSSTEPCGTTPPSEHLGRSIMPQAGEVAELKKQLEDAKERMAQMDLQLTQSRLAQHTMEEAIGSPFPAAQHLAVNIANHNIMPGTHVSSQHGTFGRSAGSSFERGSFNTSTQTSSVLAPQPSLELRS